MAIISYADAYKKHLEEQKNADKKDIGLTRKYSLESGSDPGADIILGTLFMNPAKVARGISAASGKEMSEDTKKAVGWLSKVQGVDIGRGFFGAAEGITDFLAGGAAQIAGQKDAAKWIYEHSWSRDAVGADVTDEYVGDAAESKGYQLASDLLSGIGNVGFQIAVGTLIGGALAAPLEASKVSAAGAKAIQYAPLFFSASGSGTAENMQKTGELGLRENVGGLLKGGVEVLTEIVSPTGRITEAALFGKNAKGMSRYLVKHAVAKNILTNFAGEAGEEALSYVGDHYIEKWLKISDDKFSWGDLGYQAVLGGITGALFSSPSDISFVRQARKAGATVYAQGDAAVNNKINEGLIEVKLLKERGLNNDNVKLAEAALAKLKTDENLSQTTKEYYLGLAEQMVLKQNLSDQYNALAKELVAKAKADPATAQSMADAFNALVNEAGGEGKYTAADFTNENSEAARIYVVAQMANEWLSRSDAEIATDEIMRRKAALYQGTAEQKNAIRSMVDGSTVAFRVGANAYAVVTKRAGTDTYSVGFTTPGQVERDGAVYATHNLSAEKVEELLAKPMTEQQIDAGIVNRAEASGQEQEQAENSKRKRKRNPTQTTATENATTETTAEAEQAESEGQNASLSPATTESAQTEQTTEQTEQTTEQTEQTTEQTTQQAQTETTEKKVKPEDLSTVEKRLTSAFGIDGSEFTKEEWTKARECVPNIDGLTRREQARVLTLVRTAQANGINEDYMKGLARLSSVYGFGVVFEDIDVAGFYSRKNGMVVINPKNLDETFGHEIEHSFDQIVKDGKAEFRTDLSEKVKRIVGASVFDRAKAQYKADYEKLRARDGSVAELSDAELEAEATANVVGKYLSNMTLLKKLAATDYSLGRGLLAAIRRMKDKWTSAKAFAKENDSTAFAEYRKMTRIERLLTDELKSNRNAEIELLRKTVENEIREQKPKEDVSDETVISTWEEAKPDAEAESVLQPEPFTQEPAPLHTEEEQASEEQAGEEAQEQAQEQAEEAQETESTTNELYKGYTTVQEKYPKSVVAYRVGDFYEIMGENAKIVSEEIGLLLTSRDVGLSSRIPMVGFPANKAERFFGLISERGHSLAIAESSSDTKVYKGTSESNDVSEQAKQAEQAEQPKKRTPRKKTTTAEPKQKAENITTDTARISDFGEKIGGARKDEWIARGLNLTDLENMNEAEKDKYCVRDYIWRRPNYQQLIEGGQDRVALFAQNELRKSIDPKITYRYGMTAEAREARRNLYVSTVAEIRDMVSACKTKEDFQRIINDWLIGKGYVSIEYGRVNYNAKYLANPVINNNFVHELLRITQNWDSLASKADKVGFGLDASKKVPAGFEIDKAKDGTYEIIKGRFIIKRGFASYEDALTAIRNAVQRKKTKTRFVPAQLLEVHRTGYNYRNAANVEGQDYLDTFGFRGGEFGNWMSEKDRRVSMNYGYDALRDLADALGIDYRSISLGGNLAIAFGARGKGLSGAAAHYEPLRNVINLTKMNGAGSLGHEWWHALDKYLVTATYEALPGKTIDELREEAKKIIGDINGGQIGFVSDATASHLLSAYGASMDEQTKTAIQSGKRGVYAEKNGKFAFVPFEDGFTVEDYEKASNPKRTTANSAIADSFAQNSKVQTALSELSNAMKYREATQQEIDARKQHQREKYERWLSMYLEQEFKWAKIMNDGEQETKFKYERFTKTPNEKDLARYNDLQERLLKGDASAVDELNTLHKETYGYVITKETRDQIRNLSMYFMNIGEGETVRATATTESQFYKDAQLLDNVYNKDGGYWSSREEMAARAFASYVYDKIRAQSFRDDYLVGHAEAVSAIVDDKGTVAYGYPRGEDRVRINAAFDKLFETIKNEQILAEQKVSERPDLVSYSPAPVTPETDSRYLSLAHDPQKNESELRRLVKEAAEQWGAIQDGGKPTMFYHGTKSEFTVFEKKKIGDNYGGYNASGGGFDFTTSERAARLWGAKAKGQSDVKVVPVYLKAEKTFYSYDGEVPAELEKYLPSSLSAKEKADAMEYGAAFHKVLDEHGIDFKRVILAEGYDSYAMHPGAENISVYAESQIKSADPVTYDDSGNIIPLSERFNQQNDDIRYSPASPNTSGRVVTQAKPPRQTITEKITNAKGQLNRQGLRNALKEAGSVVEGVKVLTVNAQQAVENQLVLMGMTKSQAGAVMQYARSARSHSLNAAQFKLADMTGEIRSDGFLKIIEPYLAKKGEVYDAVDQTTGETRQYTAKGGELAGKLYDEFQDYYAMLHALDRAAVGKNPYSGMSIDEMKAWVEKHEKAHPDFKAAAEKLSAFNSALLDIEAQAGIRSQETVDLWKKQYPHYVPMYVQEDGTIGRAPVRGSRNMEVRRDNAVATESDHRVNDALQNYLNQLQRRIRAAKFNLVLQEVYNSADGVSYEQVGDKKVWSVRYLEIGKDGKEQIVEVGGFKSKKEAQIEYLKHQDNRVNKNVVRGDIAEFEAKNLSEQERAYLDNPEMGNDPVEAFRKVQKGRQTVNEVSFYMDGKRVTMAVSDRIYTGLADLSGVHSSVLDLGIVKFVSKINDTFKKLVTNWNPFFAVKNIARDLQDGLLNSKFGMGEFLAMYKKNAEMMMTGKYSKEWELFLANGCLEASLLSDEFNTLAKSGKSGLEQGTGVVGQFQHIKNFNTLTEALPRFTEFCLTLKHGGTIQQAIYNAADVTVNFSRSGVLTRILNKTVSPFLNPAVQGLDRVIRLFTEDGIKNNKALASLLLKAVLLAIVPMALGNAMYGNDDEYKDMKDSIKENNYLFKVGDTWLKLPRGRVVSTISGLFNRSYKQLSGQDVDWGDYGKNVLDQITPAQNVARHIGSPFYDVANNRTWYGTKIESDALQNYAVNQRYDENTSRISVWIGQLTSHFGLSPKEVNYLIDQYTGVVGDILLPTTTPAGTKGVVSYNFTVDPNTSSNLSNRFYDLYNKTMYKSNDGDVEAYYLKKRLDETKSAVSELFKQIKTINSSTELSNKEKVKQASAIRASINQLYKTALDDRRLYEQNIKDALAIENSYAVEKITAQNAKRYGLDSDAVGKYALIFGGDFVKKYDTEAEANAYKGDASKKTVYAEANRLTYGAEYALREYNVNVYDKAQTLNELGISYDEYYNYYMTARYYSGKTKKQKILAYLNGSGLSKSQIALMMYYSGYSAYADEAKKAIKASSLSAERKKELLAGITD